MTKILIGIPTYDGKDYCFDEFVRSLRAVNYSDKEVLFIDNSDDPAHLKKIEREGFPVMPVRAEGYYEKIVVSRNALREYFLARDFDYLLYLDSDVMLPADGLKRLVLRGKDMISGVYFTIWQFQDVLKVRPVIFKHNDRESMMSMIRESRIPGIYKLKSCGAGCLLVSRRALERVKFEIPDAGMSEDFLFCKSVEELGFEIFADTSVQCRHSIIFQGKNLVLFLDDGKMTVVEN